MEEHNFIETKKIDSPEDGIKPDKSVEVSEHAEAVAFVEKHRDFVEHYAKGKVSIKPAPPGLETFAFDLEDSVIYVNSMFYKKQGLSEEKTLFAICHEIEHFLEKKAMLMEDGGEKNFEKYLKRVGDSKAFSLIDNCVGDIRENKSVVSRTNEGMRDLEVSVYKEDLFAETDFTSKPRHIQFSYALLREARVPGENCTVSSDVRQALDEVAKIKGLMEVMTDTETPMSTRLKLQDKFIWPKIEALRDKDVEDKNKQKAQNGKGGKGVDGEKEETDPNKIFAGEYAEAEKKFPEAIPIKEIEKAFKKWKQAQSGKDTPDKADADYAQKIGVEKKDLQNYRKIVDTLQKVVNPETNVGILEELRNLFSRIISKRIKKALSPRYPVDEGDELVDPAQLVADVRAGNLQPQVWEDTEIKEKRGDKFGEVDVTLVCDRSSSMTEGQKATEQQKSAVLIMEVLKDFAELCEAEKINVDKPLLVKSEIYSFGAGEDDKPMKKMSVELGEAERINVLKKLHDLPGTTTDFNCLEAIDANLDEDTKAKIKIGELKKIVIVFTDGGSDDPVKVQIALKGLVDNGVVVIGVGITEAGQPVLSTYAPNALVVEDVTKLTVVLGELLKEHLKDL